MAKLIIKRQPPRLPTSDDVAQAADACQGGTTARQLAGRTGMPLRTAMAALALAQKDDGYIKTEYVPLDRSHAAQHLLYRRLG